MPPAYTAVTIPIIILGGMALLYLFSRRQRDQALLWLVLGSAALRIALALALYYISAFGLPIFRDLQIADGFWRMASDGPGYHRVGTELAQFLIGERKDIEKYWHYLEFVAATYLVFGAHPLHAILPAALLGSGSALVVYALARRLSLDRRNARWAAALVAFWPSSLLWSALLMKDAVSLFLTLGLAYCSMRAAGGRLRTSVSLAFLGIFLSVWLLTWFRFYVVQAWLGALAVVVVIGVVRRSWSTVARLSLIWVATAGVFVGGNVLSTPRVLEYVAAQRSAAERGKGLSGQDRSVKRIVIRKAQEGSTTDFWSYLSRWLRPPTISELTFSRGLYVKSGGAR